METVAAEKVDVVISEVAAEDVEEEVNKVEEDTDEEGVEEAEAHIKIECKSHMSPVTFNIWSGLHSQTIQGRGSLSTRFTQSSWQIKIVATPALSVMKRITRIGLSLRLSLGFKAQA